MDQDNHKRDDSPIKFFQGPKGKPDETMEKLRDGAERIAYLVSTGDILPDEPQDNAIRNYAEGISSANGKPRWYNEAQIRKYMKEKSWERDDEREP